MFPSALPARRETSYNAWVTIQIGCDNNCAFCIVPAVRGVEMSRPFDDRSSTRCERSPQQGVTEVTLLGQNVNSYGRDLQLAARQAGDETRDSARCSPSCCATVGAVDGHPPGPFHQPAPQGHAARDVRRHGRRRRRSCEHLHYPLQSGSDRVLATMHRGYTAERYLDRLADGRRDASPTWRCRPTSSSASRARPRPTSSARWRSPQQPNTTTPTCSSSRPATGTEAADDGGPTSSTRQSSGSASSACGSSSSVPRCARHEARVGRIEEVLVEGPSKRDPVGHQSVARGRTSSSTSRRRRRCAPAATPRSRSRTAPRTISLGELRRAPRRADPPAPHPRRRALIRTTRPLQMRKGPPRGPSGSVGRSTAGCDWASKRAPSVRFQAIVRTGRSWQ